MSKRRGADDAAVDNYIRVPKAYLTTPWFRGLSPRQRDVFVLLLMYTRLDKATPRMCAAVSMRAIGKELGMSPSQVASIVAVLAERGALVITPGNGRGRNVYRLAEPASIVGEPLCSASEYRDVNTTGACVQDSRADVNTTGCDVENPVENGGNSGGEPSLCSGARIGALNTVPTPTERVSSRNSLFVDRLTAEPEGNVGETCPLCGKATLQPIGKHVAHPKDPSKTYCPRCRKSMHSRRRVLMGGQDRAMGGDW